ncbi:MAG UNVERIFIED_CONTAM: hypothetical protein LVR18_32670 [Planctomycetaceae bacterium]
MRLMVGREISRFFTRTSHQPGPVMLEARDLTTTAWPRHRNSFSIRSGEIVGVAGLVGGRPHGNAANALRRRTTACR